MLVERAIPRSRVQCQKGCPIGARLSRCGGTGKFYSCAIGISRRRISPTPEGDHPQSKPSTHLSRKSGNAYRLSGQIDEAIAAFEAYNARSPGFGLVDLVIVYQENGQTDKAKDAANRLLSARRDFTIPAWLRTQFRRPRALLEADVEALRASWLRHDFVEMRHLSPSA